MDWAVIIGLLTNCVGAVATVLTLMWGIHSYNTESRKRREERERYQANQISAWIETSNDDTYKIVFNNSSDKPVYKSIVSILDANNISNISHQILFLSVIPPGKKDVLVAEKFGRGMNLIPGVELAFMDVNGLHWVREVDGVLKRLPGTAIDYYDLDPPISWENLSEVTSQTLRSAWFDS